MNEGEADPLTAPGQDGVCEEPRCSLLSFVGVLTLCYSLQFSCVSRHQRVSFQLAGEGLRSRDFIYLYRSL